MIRIMTASGPETTTITVDGTLCDGSVETVRTCCTDALSKGKPVRLHLRDVSAIDERGRTMLRHLASAGVDLKANGIYSSYVVDEIQSAGRRERRGSR
jgi:flavoprotein